MADDQNTKQKTMDINDLVRELSKSSTSPVTPPPTSGPAPQISRSPFSVLKPSVSSPTSDSLPTSPPPINVPRSPVSTTPIQPPGTPRPQFNALPPLSQPKSVVVPPPIVTPSPAPGVKEYQSSIRTMSEDISKIKQGQKPVGVDIPRKVERVAPVPQPITLKPAMPGPQFKVPNVNLGEAKKTGPITQSKDFSRPNQSLPSSVPIVPKVDLKSQIYIPQEGTKGGNRNILFIGIGALILVAGIAYWFFVLRLPAPEVVTEIPTPTPTAIPIQDLNSIFLGTNVENISVKDPAIDLNTATKILAINGGEFKVLNVTSESKGQFVLGLLDFIAKPVQQLIDNMGSDYKVLLYGQKEIFDSNGQLKINPAVEKRLVFINEVKDALTAVQLGKDWEASMNEDFRPIFEFDPKKKESVDFSNNFYGGFPIRYKNFKYADRSIDYAIVSVSNGKSYLIIAGSREAIYATIDKLKGF